MLRLGLIGVGHGSTLMQVNSPEHDDVPMRVTAVCDVNEDRMAAAAAEYGVSRTTTDFRELVEGDDIDVVGVYSPGPLHADQVVAALDAGKHVMVTKSMVYSIEEAERVVEAVDRTGLVLLVTQTMRGDAKHMESKRLCDSGVIGDLLVGEATYIHDLRPVYARTPWRTQMPQDLLLGGACHPIDALRWFFGDVDEVHCYGLRGGVAKDYPQEDNFVINLRFKSGRIGRVAALCGVVHPPTLLMNGLNIYGTRGSIVDDRVRLEPEGIVPSREYDVTFPETQRGHGTEMIVMMDHMVDCVVNGATPWVGVARGRQGRRDRPRVLGVDAHRPTGQSPQRLLDQDGAPRQVRAAAAARNRQSSGTGRMEVEVHPVTASTRQARRRGPQADDKLVLCDICGAEMLASHCKLRCVHCGYTRDCSDP